MAQLRDSVIDGNLEITGDVVFKTTDKSILGIHPESGEASNMLHLSQNGNTVVGLGGYNNQNGNSHIYGNDVAHYIASAGNVSYRPYYRAGDVIDFQVRAAGYITNSGQNLVFTIPITKPVIGAPTATATSNNGFVLRQGGKYTHGSDGANSAGTVYAKPTGYKVESNYNSGFIVTAYFDVTTNVINNDAIGIYWDGAITLS